MDDLQAMNAVMLAHYQVEDPNKMSDSEIFGKYQAFLFIEEYRRNSLKTAFIEVLNIVFSERS